MNESVKENIYKKNITKNDTTDNCLVKLEDGK